MSRKHEENTTNASFGARTDVGRMRPQNEDSLVARAPLFAVADGMGGHEAGEVASEIAVETLAAQAPPTADARALGRAVMSANRAVIRAAENGIGKEGMGTTMTATILDGTKLVVAQVGDSRAYLLHEGRLSQITRDHSLMADMIEAGQITEEEARWHPQRSVITRALGSDPDMIPDLFDLVLDEGDRVLLCSDGLSGMVYNDELERILLEHPDPQDCADALIAAANANGGHDNITAIVMDVTGEKAVAVERKRAGKARLLVTAFVVAFLAIVLVSGLSVYLYAQNSAYLIAQDGYVAVYRGIPGSIGPLHLSWFETRTSVKVSDLSGSTEEGLQTGIPVSSLDEAYSIVNSYQSDIDAKSSSSSSSSSAKTSVTANSSTSTTGSTSNGTTAGGSTTGSTTTGSTTGSTTTGSTTTTGGSSN